MEMMGMVGAWTSARWSGPVARVARSDAVWTLFARACGFVNCLLGRKMLVGGGGGNYQCDHLGPVGQTACAQRQE